MNNPKLSISAANAAANALAVLLNTGFVDLFTGSQPVSADTAITSQVLLCSVPLPATAFSTASGGVATAHVISSSVIGVTGTSTWFRAYQADHSTVVFDGTVGTSAADCIVDSTAMVASQSVTISSFTITESRG